MTASKMKNAGAYFENKLGVVPAARSAGASNGTGFDKAGALSCKLVVLTGAATGTPTTQSATAKIQHSDDNSTFADYTPPDGSASVAVTAVDSTGSVDVDLSGAKQYIRVVMTTAFTGGTTPTLLSAAAVELAGKAVL